jgi:GTP-binding protein
MTNQQKIRNIAIIAHVDHGKTTLVDELFRQSGMFRENQQVAERMMDSMDLERERGITIAAKNGSFRYRGHQVNVIDTPGHADFGGQVERVLKMADGALLVVDAQEGPMPQTYFVLKKALSLSLPIIVVVNKIDKPAARPNWALDQVFELFIKLEAPDSILDFPVIYASAKNGYARNEPNDDNTDLVPLYEMIIKHVPPPQGDPDAPLQMLVSSIDYSPYMGRLGIGKITAGTLNVNKEIAVSMRDGSIIPARISKVFGFEGMQKIPIEIASIGHVVAVAGMDEVTVGVTFTDPATPNPLPPIIIDPPTISMNFIPNDSPFAGTEGKFVTSRHIQDRLMREILSDVALNVEPLQNAIGYKVSGRGELHLSILIESMRREGYEFQVTSPQVIMHVGDDGKMLEPFEELTVDVDEKYAGVVIEKLGARRGIMQEMAQDSGMARMKFKVPTRGLLGYKSEFMTDTKGMGVMNYVFAEYGPHAGDIRTRSNGVLIAKEPCASVAYALFNLQERGKMFVGPGVKLYRGMIVGEHCRSNDLVVNPGKEKKLTNIRAAGSDENILLTPPVEMSLEECIAYINEDELVEITPKSIRLRKKDGTYSS